MLTIAAITLLSAAAQILVPRMALQSLGLEATPPLQPLLVLASGLSALFGAALAHSIIARHYERAITAWAGLAKLCGPVVIAAGAVQGLVGGWHCRWLPTTSPAASSSCVSPPRFPVGSRACRHPLLSRRCND